MSASILVVDTSAPTATLALGAGGRPGIARALPQKATSERLLATIDELLTEGGVSLTDLTGLLAVRGPGSFTGLRIGLATLYGLHQATGVPAATITTLEALGRLAPAARSTVAIVDALRREWFAQTFRDAVASEPVPEPKVLTETELLDLEIDDWIGCREPPIAALRESVRFTTPRNLAAGLLQRLDPARLVWDPSSLLHPLYLRGPAVTISKVESP